MPNGAGRRCGGDHDEVPAPAEIESNIHAVREWPGNILYERIVSAMADGKIDPDEERELLEVIHKVSGGIPGTGGPAVSGAVPYDNPVPPILHEAAASPLRGSSYMAHARRCSK